MAVYTDMRAVLQAPATLENRSRLASLFDDHADRLYRLARRVTTSREDAKDLVQETFLRAAKSLCSIPNGPHAEEAWLVRVLINLQRDRWRKARVHKEAPLVECAYDANIDGALHARRLVWRTLAMLHPRRRAVIVMHDLEGLSVAEIGRLLGITAVTVRWHRSVGRRTLKRLLEGVLDEDRS